MKKILAPVMVLSLLGLVLLAAAGCGGGGGTGYVAPTKSPSTGGAGSGGGTPAAAATVTMANFAFDPTSVTVKAGGKVTWKNNDSAPHQPYADDNSFQGPVVQPGGSWSTTIAKAGTVPYHCNIHKSMTGTIVVK